MLVAVQWPAVMRFDTPVQGIAAGTSEFTSVEMLQNILLLFCVGVFAWIASRDRLRRPMAVGLAILFLIFLIRELDFFLDYYVLDNLWQVLAAALLSVAIVYGYREQHRFAQGWRRSWPSAGLAMIIGGVILLIPFAQLLGHEELWQIILGERYIRVMKVVAEEMLELGAYALITLGSIEFLYAWSRLPRTRNIAAPPVRSRA